MWRGLDPAVVYGFVWRIWQVATVPVTLYLVSVYFSPAMQGYYYTFSSLVALQSFFELGLFLVIVNLASHEWAGLSIDESGSIVGDPRAFSRLISLGRFTFGYFLVAGALFAGVVSFVGYFFFHRQGPTEVHWQAPWLVFVALTALNLVATAIFSLLEGCGQVGQVYRMRLGQAISAAAASWLVIRLGGGLWALVAMLGAQLAWVGYFVAGRYRAFFRPFGQRPPNETLSWRREVWPLQWRLACSGLVNYFASSLFNPVMFHYHGAAMAGRMGMTLQVTGGIQTLATIWLTAKVPQLGVLVACREFAALDRLWTRTLRLSLASFVGAAGVLFSLTALALHWQFAFVDRLLPLVPLAGFLVAGVLMNLSQAMSAYLRAHKQEPMFLMSICTSLLTGLLVWLLGRRFGANGAAWSYAAVLVIGLVWQYRIWQRSRTSWHA
jgi:hypothetical protein